MSNYPVSIKIVREKDKRVAYIQHNDDCFPKRIVFNKLQFVDIDTHTSMIVFECPKGTLQYNMRYVVSIENIDD